MEKTQSKEKKSSGVLRVQIHNQTEHLITRAKMQYQIMALSGRMLTKKSEKAYRIMPNEARNATLYLSPYMTMSMKIGLSCKIRGKEYSWKSPIIFNNTNLLRSSISKDENEDLFAGGDCDVRITVLSTMDKKFYFQFSDSESEIRASPGGLMTLFTALHNRKIGKDVIMEGKNGQK